MAIWTTFNLFFKSFVFFSYVRFQAHVYILNWYKREGVGGLTICKGHNLDLIVCKHIFGQYFLLTHRHPDIFGHPRLCISLVGWKLGNPPCHKLMVRKLQESYFSLRPFCRLDQISNAKVSQNIKCIQYSFNVLEVVYLIFIIIFRIIVSDFCRMDCHISVGTISIPNLFDDLYVYIFCKTFPIISFFCSHFSISQWASQ